MTEQKPRGRWVDELFERMERMFREHQWASILRSYTLVSRDERRGRLQAIMDLSVALAQIRETNVYASALHGDLLIETIIEGDWENARRIVADIRFDEVRDEDERRVYTMLWAPFRARAQAACDDAMLRERVETAEATGKMPTRS